MAAPTQANLAMQSGAIYARQGAPMAGVYGICEFRGRPRCRDSGRQSDAGVQQVREDATHLVWSQVTRLQASRFDWRCGLVIALPPLTGSSSNVVSSKLVTLPLGPRSKIEGCWRSRGQISRAQSGER
jgi:hypothetical protein